ncbi:trichohyalin isoform X2 [Carassius auratus]|uniref:Trichohyalin isoform X2 n=1 Tax=Carassius auratus TaxID=7957 RepID=A0A6P6MHK7_CARAU|nr:trichohyalin-like isoform X2 [Carassius auratus]
MELCSAQSDPVQAPQGDDDPGSFGVRVHVQGIAGQPYVVLNAQARCAPCSPEYPHVFLPDPQRQEFVSNMSGRAASTQTQPDQDRSLRALKMPSVPLLNYQRSPEVLRAPRGWSSPSSPLMVKRARIPEPGAGWERVQELEVESVPFQPSHIICRRSAAAPEMPHSRTSRSLESTSHRTSAGQRERSEVTGVRDTSAGQRERSEVTGVRDTSAGQRERSEVTGVRDTSAGQRERSEVTGVRDTSAGQRETSEVTGVRDTSAGQRERSEVTGVRDTSAKQRERSEVTGVRDTSAGQRERSEVTGVRDTSAGQRERSEVTGVRDTSAGQRERSEVTGVRDTSAGQRERSEVTGVRDTSAGQREGSEVTGVRDTSAGQREGSEVTGVRDTSAGQRERSEVTGVRDTSTGQRERSEVTGVRDTSAGQRERSEVTGVRDTSTGQRERSEVTGVRDTSAGQRERSEVTGVRDTSAGQRERSEVTGVRNTSAGQQERSEVKEENGSGQATPDLLKGRRELPDQLDEETAKLVMVNYLKEGSCEGEAIIRQKVELMFDKIPLLKFSALEEMECAAPLVEVNDLTDRRAALERHLTLLQQQLQEAQQSNESLSEQKEERNAELRRLQEALERSEQEQIIIRHKLTDMEKELQISLDQLLQARRARDQCRSDMRDLQQQLSDIHDELDSTKSCEAGERDRLLQDLCQLRGEFEALQRVQEDQEEALHRRDQELRVLRGALEEEISAHARDVEVLQHEHQQEIHRLLDATQQAKESVALLGQKVLEVAAEQGAGQTLISELKQTKAELQQKICTLEQQMSSLQHLIQQKQEQETLLTARVEQQTMEKQNLEEELKEVRQQEEDMCGANRALMRHLEDTQVPVRLSVCPSEVFIVELIY